ncbi:hypothetical protein L9F63_026031, partial [Diploptera punctata]
TGTAYRDRKKSSERYDFILNNTRDNKETTINQSARATPTHPAPTTNTTSTTVPQLSLL